MKLDFNDGATIWDVSIAAKGAASDFVSVLPSDRESAIAAIEERAKEEAGIATEQILSCYTIVMTNRFAAPVECLAYPYPLKDGMISNNTDTIMHRHAFFIAKQIWRNTLAEEWHRQKKEKQA